MFGSGGEEGSDVPLRRRVSEDLLSAGVDGKYYRAYILLMPAPTRQLSFTDARMHSGRGGPREGAGRPRGRGRRVIHHVRRDPIAKGMPCHVTVRVRKDVPSLRRKALLLELRRSFRKACERGTFRVVHYSVQRDHVHLLVEAAGKEALGNGMRSIAPRIARAVNRVFARTGKVLVGRYHVRVLKSPREVRNALRYVLLNSRRHWWKRHQSVPPLRLLRLDEGSSSRWFTGWKRKVPRVPLVSSELPEVAQPRTWLLSTGWRRHGLIDPAEVPGMAATRR
jgi:REP element-mobilizing transposase RayT